MNKYLVEYYYLATGMEGIPDRRILGEYTSVNKDEAIQMAIKEHYGHMSERDQDWVKSCLTAHLIN